MSITLSPNHLSSIKHHSYPYLSSVPSLNPMCYLMTVYMRLHACAHFQFLILLSLIPIPIFMLLILASPLYTSHRFISRLVHQSLHRLLASKQNVAFCSCTKCTRVRWIFHQIAASSHEIFNSSSITATCSSFYHDDLFRWRPKSRFCNILWALKKLLK